MVRPRQWRWWMGALALLVHAGPVSAGNLSIRFASGGAEVTLAPWETAAVEIVWTSAPQGKTARNAGAINNRFNVSGSAEIEVTDVLTELAGWDTSVSMGLDGPLADFFASADGTGSPIVETSTTFESVVQEITILNVDGSSGSAQISFRVTEALPDVITSTGGQWTLVAASPGAQQFDIGQGSPGYVDLNGDSNAAAPLVIHFVAGSGGGGGGGGDPGTNTNDNAAPPPDDNDNVAVNDNDNDNVVVEDNENENTSDGGNANDNSVVVDPSDNDNQDAPVNDNQGEPDPGATDDNADDEPDGNENQNDSGGGAINDNRPRGGGGGGGGFGCGIGLVASGGWIFATLALQRLSRRRAGPLARLR